MGRTANPRGGHVAVGQARQASHAGGRALSATTHPARSVTSPPSRRTRRGAEKDREGDGHPLPRRQGVHRMRFRRRRGRIGNGLAVLSGARPDVLAAAPGARAKFVALGGVLLSTGGLALVSMAFAVLMALGVWWPFALLIGLGWGFVVVNLDRMLLVGMAHDSSLKRNLILAVPRVGLALILGVVIATPLTMQVFSKEIDTEIVVMQAEAGDAYRASLAEDARFAHLPELEERIAAAEAVVASGGVADDGLAVVRAEVTARQVDLDLAVETSRALEAKAQCELDGTCGTGEAGTGTAYV